MTTIENHLATNHLEEVREHIEGLPVDQPGRDDALEYIDGCLPVYETIPAETELRFFFGLSVRASADLILSDALLGEYEIELAELRGCTEQDNG